MNMENLFHLNGQVLKLKHKLALIYHIQIIQLQHKYHMLDTKQVERKKGEKTVGHIFLDEIIYHRRKDK